MVVQAAGGGEPGLGVQAGTALDEEGANRGTLLWGREVCG
jgi:hypothetical protein